MTLAIFGAGGLGREVLETAQLINEKENKYNEIIFVVDNVTEKNIQGINVYNIVDAISKFGNEIEYIIAIGEPAVRARIIKNLENNKCRFATLIHPNAQVSKNAKIGKGVYVGFNSFVSCNVELRDNVFVQPNNCIGHDTIVGKNSIISSMDVISGNVIIGENTYIAPNTPVIQGCKIGNDVIIGMGSSVLRGIPDNVIAIGTPARPMKNNDQHKVFK